MFSVLRRNIKSAESANLQSVCGEGGGTSQRTLRFNWDILPNAETTSVTRLVRRYGLNDFQQTIIRIVVARPANRL